MFQINGIVAAALLLVSTQAAAGDWRFSTVAGAGGVPLTVVESGERGKPGILFVHGYGQSALSWEAQLDAPELKQDFHLVAFDLRGHGASGKPWSPEDYASAAWAGDMVAVMAATGLQQPVVVAWSFGGNVAMHYVRERGIGRLAGLQFVGTAGRLVEFVTPPEPNEPGWIEDVLSGDMRANMRAARSGVARLTAGVMPDDWVEQAMWVSATLPVYAKHAIGYGDEDNSDLADGLQLPVDFANGELDQLVSPATAAAAAAAVPNASVHIFPGVGHAPFAESPDAFNNNLRSFAGRAHASARTDPLVEVQAVEAD